jgi:hypothetical protein
MCADDHDGAGRALPLRDDAQRGGSRRQRKGGEALRVCAENLIGSDEVTKSRRPPWMLGLLHFVLAILVLPFKSKTRLEADFAELRHQLIVLRRKLGGRVRPRTMIAGS